MITGSIKNKIDAIWQDFYNENMAQTSEIVNQLTTLMFIKMLDDKQNEIEANAAMIGIQPKQSELVFKEGNYKYYEMVNGERQLIFEIPYADLRWKNFKNLNPTDLARRIKNYVVKFIKDPDNASVGQFGKYAKRYSFGFDDKERLLAAVVDKLSDSEFDFNKLDLMGDVYEYMCGSGISGQYRTPRHIIDMAVQMMKPKLGDAIIDPAMGTAGFLIEAAKYIKEHQSKELLNVKNKQYFQTEMFYGNDNDPNMARIGYMNAILHGISNPHFSMDSLLENENLNPYYGKFDLVLANPPFSGSLVESATNGKVLSITKTKKTELLFVALMDLLLKPGGRCMTIVPDGVLTNGNAAFTSLRRELIDKQKLIGVVSMPMGIFSASSKKGSASKGAGVKTSFLIFEKTNNGGTDNVWFYNMTNDGFTLDVKRSPIDGSNIPDIINRFDNIDEEFNRKRTDPSFMVPVAEIREKDYDLSFNKYKQIEKEEVNYRSTKEIFDDLKENYKQAETLMKSLEDMLGEEK
ncbi:MAG: type I restriction-modification system subunit M [Clostridia bacterium]|nr:type I restriction-modification system subunit M [Clostridia bacterium]